MSGARRIVTLRPMAVAIVAPLMIGLTVQAIAPGNASGVAGQDSTSKASTLHQAAAKKSPAATLSLADAPVGQSASGKAGLTPGVATFNPARPGRTVLIQGLYDGRWKTVVRTQQDRAGEAAFNVAASTGGKSVTFRAVAPRTSEDAGAVSRSTRIGGYVKVWGDEFGGRGKLDPAVWSARQVGQRVPPRRLCSEVRAENAYKKGGSAVLVVKKLKGKSKKCPNGQFSNAMVAAPNPIHQIKYGYVAARIKFQSNRGQHSAVWLQTPDGAEVTAGKPSTSGAEIDIAEYFGDNRKHGGLASYVHWLGPKNKGMSVGGEPQVGKATKKRKMLRKGQEWSDKWHVYSVEWTPTRYVFRVDGKVTFSTNKGVSQREEMVILSALTSDWETPAMNAKRFPTVTKYDWVRVYQKPSA